MKEHADMPIDTSNMSEQELQFHYFKMHDSDGNNKLDGCELVKSLIHWHGMETLGLLRKCEYNFHVVSLFQTRPTTKRTVATPCQRRRSSKTTSWCRWSTRSWPLTTRTKTDTSTTRSLSSLNKQHNQSKQNTKTQTNPASSYHCDPVNFTPCRLHVDFYFFNILFHTFHNIFCKLSWNKF